MLTAQVARFASIAKLHSPAAPRLARAFAGNHDASGNDMGESQTKDPDVLEKGKQQSKKGEAWVEHMASDSEAAVKADKHPEDDIAKLQQRTEEKAKGTH